MDQSISQKKTRWLRYSIFAILIVSCIACSPAPKDPSLSPSSQLLPGEEIWKHGISSFLFGTNDTHEWSAQNFETQPAIQKSLRNARFTLIRSFFQNGASDSDIKQRIRAIENSGAHCLGIIDNIFNGTYDKHLVQYLGSRCLMYEFGNEPDLTGISIDAYLKQWNSLIPVLRHINPAAKFIGPVVSQGSTEFIQGFLTGVKTSHVLPDAISFHWYPCSQDSETTCLSKADTAGKIAMRVRALVKNVLGKDLPIGITEWNFDPSNPPPAYDEDKNFMNSFTKTALQSMIQANVAFACQFDAASYAGYGHLDMFDRNGHPKAQYYTIKALIATYMPS